MAPTTDVVGYAEERESAFPQPKAAHSSNAIVR